MSGSICHLRAGHCERARKMHGSEKSRGIGIVSDGQNFKGGQNLGMQQLRR
jgi:hypothetical protein